ncbi:unnamed protein product [Cutaneotrichosporon oleaginosum]
MFRLSTRRALLRPLSAFPARAVATSTVHPPPPAEAPRKTPAAPSPVRAPPETLKLLSRLHARSKGAGAEMAGVDSVAVREYDGQADRIVALSEDKAYFVYSIIRAARGTRVVVIGAGFGVGTVYCALAAQDNARDLGKGRPRVVATEYRRMKVQQAREVWNEAGVSGITEVLEGDLAETLKDAALKDIDFVLLDGEPMVMMFWWAQLMPDWTPKALPALKLLQPHLRPGATIVANDTAVDADAYAEFLQYVDKDNAFQRISIPYLGGLTMMTYYPQQQK